MLLTRTWAVKLISHRLSNLVCDDRLSNLVCDVQAVCADGLLYPLNEHPTICTICYCREYTTFYIQACHLLCQVTPRPTPGTCGAVRYHSRIQSVYTSNRVRCFKQPGRRQRASFTTETGATSAIARHSVSRQVCASRVHLLYLF